MIIIMMMMIMMIMMIMMMMIMMIITMMKTMIITMTKMMIITMTKMTKTPIRTMTIIMMMKKMTMKTMKRVSWIHLFKYLESGLKLGLVQSFELKLNNTLSNWTSLTRKINSLLVQMINTNLNKFLKLSLCREKKPRSFCRTTSVCAVWTVAAREPKNAQKSALTVSLRNCIYFQCLLVISV